MLNILLFMGGSILASFAVCQASRFKLGLSIVFPRSFCDHCAHPLCWWQLIPIVGWLLQKGHCYFCHNKISPLSTYLEGCYGILFILLNYFTYDPYLLFFAGELNIWLLLLALQDHYTMHVSNWLLCLGGIFQVILAGDRVFSVLHHDWLELVLIFLLLITLCLTNKMGSADLICLLVILLIEGFIFGIELIFLTSILFLAKNFRAPKQQELPFLPSLTVSFVLLTILNQLH